MNIFGIIAEYNPFHNGHYLQVCKTKEMGATHIVAAMSGNFVQRGDIASFSKWTRAKAALLNGVDLVIEIPTPYAISPAQDFAHAGVYLLNQLKINSLCFGSECGSIDILKQTAKYVEIAQNDAVIKEYLNKGLSYPIAREKAVKELFGAKFSKIIKSPNNLLGLEYINAINKINPLIEPVTIAREGVEHDSNSAQGEIASASMIRGILGGDYGNYVPQTAYEEYMRDIELSYAPCGMNNLDKVILYKLRMMTTEQIKGIKDVAEGLENRIKSALTRAETFDELVEFIATKRYTNARIRRILLNCLLDIRSQDFIKEYEYIKVLGMNKKGMEILKNAGDSSLKISPKFASIYNEGYAGAQFENKATDIFALSSPKIRGAGLEFFENTIVIKE